MLPLSLVDFGINRIRLEDLPAPAQLMRRVDRKYRIGADHIGELLRLIEPHYSLVQTGMHDEAVYMNRYWDGRDNPFFHAHRVRKPRRFKFRQRTYAADGRSFWELKERQATGYTRKMRLETEMGNDHKGAQEALSRLWNRTGFDPPCGIHPKLDIHYKRLTFVHANGHERLTLDYDLRLSTPSPIDGTNASHSSPATAIQSTGSTCPEHKWLCSHGLYILELKQNRPGPSVLDTLRRARSLQAISFSKYYIGSLLWQAHERPHQPARPLPTKLGYVRDWHMHPYNNPTHII